MADPTPEIASPFSAPSEQEVHPQTSQCIERADTPLLAQGSDYQQGGFFNQTRMMIRSESVFATARCSNGTTSPSLSLPGQLNSTPPGGPTQLSRLSSTKRPPAVGVEDYLQSLLPNSGFNGSSSDLTLPVAGFNTAPDTPYLTQAYPHKEERNEPSRNSGTNSAVKKSASFSAARVEPDDSPTLTDGGDGGHNALMATYHFQQVTADGGVALAFDDLEGAVDDESIERLHNAIGTLMSEQNNRTTSEFEDMVAREVEAFNRMHASMRPDRTDLQQQQQQLNGTAPAVLTAPGGADADVTETDASFTAQAMTDEEAALGPTPLPSDTSAGTRVTLETVTEEDERASARPASAGGAHTSSARPVLLPALAAQPDVAPTPEAGPCAAAATPALEPSKPEPSAAGPSAAKPPRASPSKETAKGPVPSAPPVPEPPLPTHKRMEIRSEANQDEKTASIRLLQRLQSVKDQLTATIQLGFQQGRFKSLNIAILVVGTRGDVQPFVGIGLKLQAFGHRVRIASHAVYREFVTGFGLEFYPLGGDPKVLSEFVVKHRGIMPGWNLAEALQQREQVREILYSTWGACTAPDPKRPDKVFRADAIVANPPSYGHTHCAEALNIPLHVVFTMPWTPTKAFPQPFARIRTNMGAGQNSKAREVMNWMSYFAMEDLAWLGMAGMQKDFRQRVLGLPSWNKYTTSHAIYYSQVPITYIWSPSLVPRPPDWPMHCEVVGFCSVELRKLTSYDPPAELKAFLDAGPPPVYIGFGSLVVDQPAVLTQQFLAALKRTGLRAIIQRGWGGLGAEYGTQPDGKPGKKSPPDVLFIDAAPHDWLFQCVSAVVHHGGAGTTAAGLLAGKPTFIVPFFGDQPFWGAAVALAGAGPAPVPIDNLNTEKIVDALKELILPTRQQAALRLAKLMLAEDGITAAVDHIHRTIYTTLLGRNTPIWMQNNKQSQATTSIQEMEDGNGPGLLRGMLQLPTRIFRNLKSKALDGPGRGSQTSVPPTPSVHNSARAIPGTGSSNISSNLLTPQPVEVVGGEVKRRGILAFLGC